MLKAYQTNMEMSKNEIVEWKIFINESMEWKISAIISIIKETLLRKEKLFALGLFLLLPQYFLESSVTITSKSDLVAQKKTQPTWNIDIVQVFKRQKGDIV